MISEPLRQNLGYICVLGFCVGRICGRSSVSAIIYIIANILCREKAEYWIGFTQVVAVGICQERSKSSWDSKMPGKLCT